MEWIFHSKNMGIMIMWQNIILAALIRRTLTRLTLITSQPFFIVASVGVTPRSKQLGVTPRTPLFEGKNPENQKLKISIK